MQTITKKAITDSPFTNYIQTPTSNVHNHTFWEIFIILNGHCEHYINGKTINLSMGSVVFLRPMKDYHSFQHLNSDATYRQRDFYIDDNDMRKWCDNFSVSLYDEIASPEMPISFTLSTVALNFFEEMLFVPDYSAQNLDVKKSVHFSIVNTLLTMIMLSRLPKKALLWIDELVAKLKNPENFTYTIKELTADTPYSHCHICKEFNKYTGQTLINFFTSQKMNYASYLLMNTNMKIIDVANAVGYESPKNFIHQFTRTFATTPSKWRHSNQLSIKK